MDDLQELMPCASLLPQSKQEPRHLRRVHLVMTLMSSPAMQPQRINFGARDVLAAEATLPALGVLLALFARAVRLTINGA